MAHGAVLARAASLGVLLLALVAGLWRAEALSFASQPLISPRWQLGLPNTTSNFSASAPVTWELLMHDNSKHVVDSLPGYEYVQITAMHIEILAGTRGGLFHLRAVAKHCSTGIPCAGTSTWVVLSWGQFSMLGFGAAGAVGLCSFALLRRLQPPPETPESRNEESIRLSVMEEHYGTVSPQPPGRASPLGPKGGLPYGRGVGGAGPGGYAGAGAGGAGGYGGNLGLPPGGYSPPGGRLPRGQMPVRTYDASGRLGPPRRSGGAGDCL